MEILRLSLNNIPTINAELCACIGYFDGFHQGHQGLFNATLNKKAHSNYKAALITFEPDPWSVIKDLQNIEHLSSIKQRVELAQAMGFDYFIILEFNKQMANLEPQKFIDTLILPINLKYLVCGFDFHFGTRGSGDSKFLKNNQKFEVEEIMAITYLDEKISSTRITKCIENGEIELANFLLGRPFMISGEVIHGKAIGRTYGFPTANIKMDDLYIKPKRGVYIGRAIYKQKAYIAIINVGHNPTFNYVDALSIEAYILDFKQEIYHEALSLEFHKFLREEKKFQSKDDLIDTLKQNVLDARDYFEKV